MAHSFTGDCPLCHVNAVFTINRHSSGESGYQCQNCGGFPPARKRQRTTRGMVYASAKRSKAAKLRRNPIPGPHAAETRDAAAFAAAFHGREPDTEHVTQKPVIPNAMACIGKIVAIEYSAERDGKVYTFRHAFKASSRPYLAVSPDGKTVQMLGGAFEFTDRGFEDC